MLNACKLWNTAADDDDVSRYMCFLFPEFPPKSISYVMYNTTLVLANYGVMTTLFICLLLVDLIILMCLI